MELRQLRHFLAVVDHGSFSRAAQMLGKSQQALSKSVHALEQSLGVRLLDRNPRAATLTAFGQLLLPFARNIDLEATSFRDQLAAVRRAERGRVRLGASPASATQLVTEAVLRLAATPPELQIAVLSGIFQGMERELLAGDLDLFVCIDNEDDVAEGVTREVLLDDEYRIVCAITHPLAKAKSVTATQLARYGWILGRNLGEIEQALQTFERRPMTFEPDQIGMAGVFISIDADGALLIERGYVRAEDETPAEPEAEIVDPETGEVIQRAEPEASRMHAVITLGGQTVETEEEDEADTIKPLPDRLVSELTAHRTLALRDAVAVNPHVAMTALLHRLVMDCFMPHSSRGCLEAQVREVHLPTQAEDLRDSASAKSIADRHERWGDHVPADDAALWDWLTDLDDGSRMDLLAHCVSYGVNALYEKPNPYSGTGVSQHGLDIRLSQADRLARSTGLDMVAVGWRPTVGNYLGRVTKPRILEAVREGAGDRAADLIGHLKKGDMAKEAERLLAETGWLPEPLRMVDDGIEVDPASAAAAEADDLPDFLSGDGEDDPADDEEEQHMVAAE